MVGPERTLAMKLGFAIPIVGSAVSSAAGLSAFCRGLEDLGYDTLWVGDRLVTPVDMHSTYPGKEQPYPPQMTRYLDPVLLWTVAATATSRVRLNASTLSTFYYEPAHLARLLTTLDVLSDGRLEVGVGLGWMKDEYDIVRGADWHRRGKMLDNVLAFLHAWWTTTPVSWDSEFFSLPPVHADLRPVQAGELRIERGDEGLGEERHVGRRGIHHSQIVCAGNVEPVVDQFTADLIENLARVFPGLREPAKTGRINPVLGGGLNWTIGQRSKEPVYHFYKLVTEFAARL